MIAQPKWDVNPIKTQLINASKTGNVFVDVRNGETLREGVIIPDASSASFRITDVLHIGGGVHIGVVGTVYMVGKKIHHDDDAIVTEITVSFMPEHVTVSSIGETTVVIDPDEEAHKDIVSFVKNLYVEVSDIGEEGHRALIKHTSVITHKTLNITTIKPAVKND